MENKKECISDFLFNGNEWIQFQYMKQSINQQFRLYFSSGFERNPKIKSIVKKKLRFKRKFTILIGSVIKITFDKVVVLVLDPPFFDSFSEKKVIPIKEIYGDSINHLNPRQCFSVGDLIICQVKQFNEKVLTTKKANLGVLCGLSKSGLLLVPQNFCTMVCPFAKSKEYRKVSILSIW